MIVNESKALVIAT